MEKNIQEIRYSEARKKLAKIKSFYFHFAVYLIVNAFIIFKVLTNVPADELNFWMFSAPFFWGLGLGMHALRVFGTGLVFSKEWERRKIKEFMEKDEF